MPKICQWEGCTLPVFSGGYCAKHHKQQFPERYRIKTNIPVRKVSKTRIKKNKLYSIACSEIDKHLKDENKWNCFFCGEKLSDNADHHHLLGRDGDLLLNKKYLVPVHRECHSLWHNAPIKTIMQQQWFEAFMGRLFALDEDILRTVLLRIEKS